MSTHIPLLALSGAVGVGKSSVLIEIHDILSVARVPHGCLERDALGYSWPDQGRFNEEMIERNLAPIAVNFLASGAERILIAGVIESDEHLASYRRCVPNAQIQVCRLTADLELRRQRLRTREKGAGLEWHLDRTAELDRILDNARIEDFTVGNGERPLREVATEVLNLAGWPT